MVDLNISSLIYPRGCFSPTFLVLNLKLLSLIFMLRLINLFENYVLRCFKTLDKPEDKTLKNIGLNFEHSKGLE